MANLPRTATALPGTRERLIAATLDLLRRRGLHGFGVSEVLAHADAPKGVLYHHFPGGKVELAIAAIESAVSQIVGSLEQLRDSGGDRVHGLRGWFERAQAQLERSGFEQGCPLAAIALESTAGDAALKQALNRGFSAIRSVLARMLADAGLPRDRAARFATLIVAAYEGALLQSRIAGERGPAEQSMRLLLQLVRADIESARPTR